MDTNQIISQEVDAEEALASDNTSDTVTFEDLGLDEYALKAV